jgi:hypothetical protein
MTGVVRRLGVVKEDEAIAGTYLAGTSRLLKRRAISYLRRERRRAAKII